MRHVKLHKHQTCWDLTPHSRQLLWSQRREQWNINASLGFRMTEGKLDLELPLWRISTQSTSCKHLLLSFFLVVSPSWFCSRSEKAVDTDKFYIWGLCKIPWKITPRYSSQCTVRLGSISKDLQDWTRTMTLFLSVLELRPRLPRRTWSQHPPHLGRGVTNKIWAASEA